MIFEVNVFLVFSLAGILIFHYLSGQSLILDNLLIVFGLLGTIPVIIGSFKAIAKRKITVDLLAAIALFVSLIQQEWTSVAFISLMITSARIFGIYTETRAKKAIQSLFKLRPNTVKIKINNQIKVIDLSAVKLNDLIIIDAGERIPIDGEIISGTASIDQSALTGESIPAEKHIGDQVLSSTLNLSGSLLVKTTRVGKDTTFEKLIHLMEQAQTQKVSIETTISKFTGKYILFTLIGSILVYVFTKNISLVLSILLVTCADDIAVAVPLAFWVAIAHAAKRGIIIKGGSYLEGLARCKILIVDKTGTLTRGKIQVSHLVSFDNRPNILLQTAAIAESVSDHPMAKAIIEYAHKNKLTYSLPDTFDELPGKGMTANFHGNNILVGNLNFFHQQKIKISPDQLHQINLAEMDGHNLVLVSSDEKILGFIALADELRYGIKNTLKKIRSLGLVRIVMLTGDNEKVAKTVAREIGIEEYHANLLPEDKLLFLKKNLNSKYKIAMVGDGINDAASLALADIGFAMGAIGSDSAIEASDIALMNDDFSKIAETIGLSRQVLRIVFENFIIWGVVNSVGLILVFTQVIGPTGSAAYNFFTDFLPLLNSLRLFRYNFHRP
ncbi:MAG: cation-translocating P-type ATPase [Candidatus Shapirobacteria bacterium]|nr:cation-translocating P-type ATPase [Candidatus Shapirobacteria bacterium]